MTHNDQSLSFFPSRCIGGVLVHQSQIEERGSEAGKAEEQGEEDEDEGDVRTNGAYEKDEADQCYGPFLSAQ